jgi:cephalosporin hydroxylase
MNKFNQELIDHILASSNNKNLLNATQAFMTESVLSKYSYNFNALGRPIIQYPQDIIAMQELIWNIKPDLIIETGIAHGGSLIMSASMLAILDMCDAIQSGVTFNPKNSKRKILGVDIDIRPHNRVAIESHPMASRIQMIEGSSIDPSIIEQVKKISNDYKCVMVCLDSNHTHDHVLAELKAYAPLVSYESYCVVFDTIIEDMPANTFLDRHWGLGNNPKTAVHEYLKVHSEFVIDKKIQDKLLITVAVDGYLKRIKN